MNHVSLRNISSASISSFIISPSRTDSSHQRKDKQCCSVTLEEAVRSALKRSMFDQAVLVALCTQLGNKWNYAADKYRADHPGMLPIEEAETRMATWIPWAIAKIRMDFECLAAMFNTLTIEQLNDIDAVPEVAEKIYRLERDT